MKKLWGLTRSMNILLTLAFNVAEWKSGLDPAERKKGRIEDAPSVEFFVDDVDAVYGTLEKKGVDFVKEPHDEP